MKTTPLIAKTAKGGINDAVFLCKEIFAEDFKKHYNTENFNNLIEYNSESDDVKLCALAVKRVHDYNKIELDEVEKVEEHIILRKSEYFLSKRIIESHALLKEGITLKPWQVLSDLPIEDVEKFSLLQKNDILPNFISQYLDFYPDLRNTQHNPGPCCKQSQTILEIRNLEKINKSSSKKSNHSTSKVITGTCEKSYKPLFQAFPSPVILFNNYEKNILYKKTITLKNISSKFSNSILLVQEPLTKCFTIQAYEINQESQRIAPGLSIRYLVTFMTNVHLNIVDRVVFRTCGNNDNSLTTACQRTCQYLTVQLCSYREPPILRGLIIRSTLNLDKISLRNVDYSEKRASSLSATLDCGNCYLGASATSHLILRNYGNKGTFAIISERDWFDSQVTHLTTNNELILRSFLITPAYFTLNYGDYIDISIYFEPDKFGLHCEHLYMLSDNNATENLDIIADGVTLSRRTVDVFSDHFDDFKQGCTSKINEANAKIHFGLCSEDECHTKSFSLFNNGLWQMKYRIEVLKKSSKGNSLPFESIKIIYDGILPENGTSNIDVRLSVSDVTTVGSHSMNLILLIENIPETAIETSEEFLVINTKKNHIGTQLVDVAFFIIEITCDIFELYLDPIPYETSLQLVPDFGREGYIQCHLRFKTEGTHTLKCKWVVPESTVVLKPMEFSIKPSTDNYQDCFFAIKRVDATTMKLLFYLHIKRAKTILFEINVAPSHLTDHNGMSILSLTQCCVTEQKTSRRRSSTSSPTCCVTMFYLEHNHVVCESIDGVTISSSHNHLIADTDSSQSGAVTEATVTDKYQVHGNHSYWPVLFIDQLLYKGQIWKEQICVHNNLNKSKNFRWSFLFGNHADFVDVKIVPTSGVLRPLSHTRFDVYISPRVVGMLDDINFNCSIGFDDISIRIMCAVENIVCEITLPDDENSVVFWPIPMQYDYNECSCPEICECLYETHEEIQYNLTAITTKASECQNDIPEAPAPSLMSSVLTEATILSNTLIPTKDINNSILSLSNTELTAQSVSIVSDVTTLSEPTALRELFDSNDLFLQDYLIEFKAVPLKTPVKKTITIRNLTPILGVVTCEVINFPALEINENKLENVMAELHLIKNSRWDKQLSEQGILIKTELSQETLKKYSKLEIDIFVYADTFGVYADELLIEINDIMPFCISVLIEINGSPIEFPLALNTIQPYPILRFGNVHYKANDITRTLRMYNSSSIPVSVLWHLLLKDLNIEKEEFNVLFDLYDKNQPYIEDSEDSLKDGSVIITRRYYGAPKQSAFQIFPTESVIEPKSYVDLKITFSSRSYVTNFNSVNLEAYLLGYIYITESYISQSYMYSRPYGKNLSPIKVKLTSTLQLPVLRFNAITNEHTFKFYATDVCGNLNNTQVRHLVFRNNHGVTVKVRATADPPFAVLSLRTREYVMKQKDFIGVEPDDCLEIEVSCHLTPDKVKDMAKVYTINLSYSNVNPLVDESTTIVKHLRFEQRAIQQQTYPLHLVVLYPKFDLSAHILDFEYCGLGSEKMKLLTVSNQLGCNVPYTFQAPLDIIIEPETGIVPGCTAAGKGYVDIKVYFVPRIPGIYSGTIRLCSNLPNYEEIIQVYGIGSTDGIHNIMY